MKPQPHIRKLAENDRVWLRARLTHHFGDPVISSRRQWINAGALDGVVAEGEAGPIGFAVHTPMRAGVECELVAIAADEPRSGVGTILLQAVADAARAARCARLLLTTSNDNLDAIRFYQRRGWRMVRIYPDAMNEARRDKPTIPVVGHYGIPMADDIELELRLGS